MKAQRTIVLRERELLHVETPLGIVNIRTGLHDADGRRVESVEIIPNDYAGEPTVTVDGFRNTRMVEAIAGELAEGYAQGAGRGAA